MKKILNKNTLEVLRKALQLLNCNSRRLPMSVYRVMVALAGEDEPLSAFAVARRAGFLLEHGRVKLYEAKRYGVVANAHFAEQGILWSLTEKGRAELARVLQELRVAKRDASPPAPAPCRKEPPALPGLELKPKKRKRRKEP